MFGFSLKVGAVVFHAALGNRFDRVARKPLAGGSPIAGGRECLPHGGRLWLSSERMS